MNNKSFALEILFFSTWSFCIIKALQLVTVTIDLVAVTRKVEINVLCVSKCRNEQNKRKRSERALLTNVTSQSDLLWHCILRLFLWHDIAVFQVKLAINYEHFVYCNWAVLWASWDRVRCCWPSSESCTIIIQQVYTTKKTLQRREKRGRPFLF